MMKLLCLAAAFLTLAPMASAGEVDRATLGQRLRGAAQLGNLELTQKALSEGADPDALSAGGGSALMAATKARSLRVMALLLKAGSNPNVRDDSGFTALYYAARDCFVDGLSLLLRSGADVNQRAIRGRTPLIAAVEGVCPRGAETILRSPKVDLFAKDDLYRSAFHYADDNWVTGDDMHTLGFLQAERDRRYPGLVEAAKKWASTASSRPAPKARQRQLPAPRAETLLP